MVCLPGAWQLKRRGWRLEARASEVIKYVDLRKALHCYRTSDTPASAGKAQCPDTKAESVERASIISASGRGNKVTGEVNGSKYKE